MCFFLTQMYNTNQRGRTTGTPSSPGGTKYFNHFPSNFLHPYGLAGPAPDHETLQRRINLICCEWLKRPHIAMSEFAATMVNNFNFLATNGNAFFIICNCHMATATFESCPGANICFKSLIFILH